MQKYKNGTKFGKNRKNNEYFFRHDKFCRIGHIYLHHLRGKLLYYLFVIELKIIEKNSNRLAVC